MPSIYEGNLSKTMVKQSNRNTLARKRAEKLKKDKEKYPLPFNIKEGMNSTIRQTSPALRAKDNQRTMVTNLIMDKYKMPYDEARAAYEDVLVPYQQKRDETTKRASFIGNKYNLDTLFTSKRESPGSESARSLTNMITPTEGGVVSENPYFKQGVGMEGFLSTTNAGRAVSDPNAPNRYRIAGDADLGRVDTPYNANTFNQQFKDIKAAFEEDPKLMAEIVGMSLAQDYVKTALPIAANAVPGGAALANTEMGKNLNRGIMQFTLANAPVSGAARETVRGDWLADPTLTSYIDPALTGLSLATGGVTGAFPVTSKLLKASKAVVTNAPQKTFSTVTRAGQKLGPRGFNAAATGIGGFAQPISRARRRNTSKSTSKAEELGKEILNEAISRVDKKVPQKVPDASKAETVKASPTSELRAALDSLWRVSGNTGEFPTGVDKNMLNILQAREQSPTFSKALDEAASSVLPARSGTGPGRGQGVLVPYSQGQVEGVPLSAIIDWLHLGDEAGRFATRALPESRISGSGLLRVGVEGAESRAGR